MRVTRRMCASLIAESRLGDIPAAQYIARPLQDPDLDGPLGRTIQWALANLDQDLEVEAMAAHATMSKRNFTRRFKEVTGLSPARWVLGRRLDDARQLLESTKLEYYPHCGVLRFWQPGDLSPELYRGLCHDADLVPGPLHQPLGSGFCQGLPRNQSGMAPVIRWETCPFSGHRPGWPAVWRRSVQSTTASLHVFEP